MSRSELALVTGGAGFIGSHLVEALLGEGTAACAWSTIWPPVSLSNLAHLEGRFEWIEGNVADFAVCRRAATGVDYVFHQAAIPSVPRSVREPLASHESGPTATINMLEAARLAGVRRFMFAASSSAYGDTTELPKHEDMLPQPSEPVCGRQAGRRTLCSRLRSDDGARRREPALLQHFRPPPRSLEPLQRRDLDLYQEDVARPAADHLRRWAADPRLYLCRQCRGRQPRRNAACGTARRGRIQRRDRPEHPAPRLGRGLEHDSSGRISNPTSSPPVPAMSATRWPAWTESAESSAIARLSLLRRD